MRYEKSLNDLWLVIGVWEDVRLKRIGNGWLDGEMVAGVVDDVEVGWFGASMCSSQAVVSMSIQ